MEAGVFEEYILYAPGMKGQPKSVDDASKV
jgi:hypothetical protein